MDQPPMLEHSHPVAALCSAVVCGFLLHVAEFATETMPIVKWLSYALAAAASAFTLYLGWKSTRKKK